MFKISKSNMYYRCGNLPANDMVIKNAKPLTEVMVEDVKMVIEGDKYIYRDGTFKTEWCVKIFFGIHFVSICKILNN